MNSNRHNSISKQKVCSVCRSRIEYAEQTLDRCIGRYCQYGEDGLNMTIKYASEHDKQTIVRDDLRKKT